MVRWCTHTARNYRTQSKAEGGKHCYIPALRTVDSNHYMGSCYWHVVRNGKRNEGAAS